MLKRQRVPSSPLSKEDSLLSIPIDAPALFPLSKRPRTRGPIIDGKERQSFSISDDDGEENIYETAIIENSPDNMRNKDYEHVNQFLHELHAACQTRTRRDTTLNMNPPASECAGRPRNDSIHVPFSSNSCSASSKDTLSSWKHANNGPIQTGDDYQRMLDEERSFVSNSYEDNNRMLGSLVLRRRRHLRFSGENDTT